MTYLAFALWLLLHPGMMPTQVLFGTPAATAPTLNNSGQTDCSSSPCTATMTHAICSVGAPCTVIASVWVAHGATALSMADGASNSYSIVTATACSDNGGPQFDQYFYYHHYSSAPGTSTLVMTSTSGGSNVEIEAGEYPVIAGTLDGAESCTSGTSSTTTLTTNSVTPAGSNEVSTAVVRVNDSATTLTPTSPYTVLFNPGGNFASEYNFVSASTSASFGNTLTGHSYLLDIVLFK